MRSSVVVVLLMLCAHPAASQTQGMVEGRSRLFYEAIGSGQETIVVIHGGPGLSHDYMRPEWDQLATSGRVIFYDQNGCGQSEHVPPYGWRSHVEDLDRLLSALSPNERVVLAGSSWGAMLALYYTYLHKARVRALILSGVPIGTVVHQMPASAPPYHTPSVLRVDSVDRDVEAGPTASRRSFEPRLARRIRDDCVDVASAINTSLRDAPGSLMLMSIPVPVLVIHGSNPEQTPADGGPKLAELMPNATLVTIANAGHDPWLDEPARFFDAANNFLSELPTVHQAPISP